MKAQFLLNGMDNINVFEPEWDVPKNIFALQTIRNTSPSKELLNKNQTKLSTNLGFDFINNKAIGLNQSHSNISVELPADDRDADASYTTHNKVVCSIRTADCMPLLITDEEGSFVAAIHAGWRGLASSIIENTLKKINSKGKFIVWIGPHISQEFFEVGAVVRNIFLENDSASSEAFTNNANGKYFLSMLKVAKLKLHRLDVKKIYITKNFCTYKNANNYYSYRRDASKERMTSLIWMEE
jgi:YfiH family protein